MTDISDKVLQIATGYLGPAAKVFLERQTSAHLGGLKFDTIERKNLPDLAKWVNISAGLIIDKAKAKEMADKLLNI
jgi:hypothetical protein